MTELIGKMMIENRAYHGEASITPSVWRKQTVMNGIQQRKSVAMMIEIFRCIFLFLLLIISFPGPCVNSCDDFTEIRLRNM